MLGISPNPAGLSYTVQLQYREPYSAIVLTIDVNDRREEWVLASFRGNRYQPTIRAEVDEFTVFVRERNFPYWLPLSKGEEAVQKPGDDYGIGYPWEYWPSIRQWTVRQKSH